MAALRAVARADHGWAGPVAHAAIELWDLHDPQSGQHPVEAIREALWCLRRHVLRRGSARTVDHEVHERFVAYLAQEVGAAARPA